MLLKIHPNPQFDNEDLLIWIAEPGDEFYLHLWYWLDIPGGFKLDAVTEEIDIGMKKVIKKKVESCSNKDQYKYTGTSSM